MKIAIIAPSPKPFTVGGAEKLWWGLQEYLNKHTSHQCELIKIPTLEGSFWELIESYQTFYRLDLSHFNLVISGKYPAWMIHHSNHHIYMLHCLRGLYDTYHFTRLPLNFQSTHPGVMAVLDLLKNEDTTIDSLFDALETLKRDTSVPKNSYDFPGSFIREIVHFLDKRAMRNVKKFSAISQTVANRKEYFPSTCKVEVIYPPSFLSQFKNSAYEYFFTVSRLDNAKRIEMIVDAYLKTKTTMPLKIAGTGPLLEALKKRTQNDSRIELLGFVSDDALIDFYANAYAVIFVPYDEDYGLITIEAMMSQKPVVTFNDTGGVVEFVEHRVTGLISEPNIALLAKNIDDLAQSPDLCRRMGVEAKKRVQNITWKNTIARLLKASDTPKRKITVVSTYPVYPPRGGGQNRIFYLYKNVAASMTVELICLTRQNESFSKKEIAPNLYEIRVPKSKSHAKKEQEMEKKAGIPITDIAMLYYYNETPQLIQEVKKSSVSSQAVISSHPYTYLLLKEYVDIAIIHESHNVEYNLKKQMLKETPYNQKLLAKLFEVEKEACRNTLFTTVCAKDDALTMRDLYGFDSSKAVVVPNGVDLQSVPFISKETRDLIKAGFGFEKQKIVLFIGSWHQPNIDAVEEIFKIALKLPDHRFIVMGSVGAYFSSHKGAKNVGFTGMVDDTEKELYLSIADVAINPMLTGSGTNLKMLDYMANGIAVVSTPVGARGLDIPPQYIVECDIEAFASNIADVEHQVSIEASRQFVEKHFSWEVIQHALKDALLKTIEA